jgi:hypothetical protein
MSKFALKKTSVSPFFFSFHIFSYDSIPIVQTRLAQAKLHIAANCGNINLTNTSCLDLTHMSWALAKSIINITFVLACQMAGFFFLSL